MKLSSNHPKAFTLIELLVVITVIGVLTGLLTVNLQDARERGRDAQRKANLKQIQNALELYKNDQDPQTYPDTATWEADIEDGEYMKEVPHDPVALQTGSWPDIDYQRDPLDTLKYDLVVCLENLADPDRDTTNSCASGVSYSLTEP